MQKPAPFSAGQSDASTTFQLDALLSQAEFPIELVDTTAGIYQFLLACKKRMAFGAYFYFDVLFCASRLNDFAAGAFDRRLMVVWMYSFFHFFHLA